MRQIEYRSPSVFDDLINLTNLVFEGKMSRLDKDGVWNITSTFSRALSSGVCLHTRLYRIFPNCPYFILTRSIDENLLPLPLSKIGPIKDSISSCTSSKLSLMRSNSYSLAKSLGSPSTHSNSGHAERLSSSDSIEETWGVDSINYRLNLGFARLIPPVSFSARLLLSAARSVVLFGWWVVIVVFLFVVSHSVGERASVHLLAKVGFLIDSFSQIVQLLFTKYVWMSLSATIWAVFWCNLPFFNVKIYIRVIKPFLRLAHLVWMNLWFRVQSQYLFQWAKLTYIFFQIILAEILNSKLYIDFLSLLEFTSYMPNLVTRNTYHFWKIQILKRWDETTTSHMSYCPTFLTGWEFLCPAIWSHMSHLITFKTVNRWTILSTSVPSPAKLAKVKYGLVRACARHMSDLFAV
jgi:hypothetical protein